MNALSKKTRKYNITLETPPMLVCAKNIALRRCLEANIPLGFPCNVFSVHTHDGALT